MNEFGGRTHGIPATYNAGCRCDTCRTADSARRAATRAKRNDHGTRSMYVAGCRCEPCKQCNNEYNRYRTARIARETVDWSQAKCAGEDPRLWDLDFYESINAPFAAGEATRPSKRGVRNGRAWQYELVRDRDGTDLSSYAARLCEGCPLLKACAKDTLLPMYYDDEGPLRISGVIRGGVPVWDSSHDSRAVRNRLKEVAA